jgi:hypothetical protein
MDFDETDTGHIRSSIIQTTRSHSAMAKPNDEQELKCKEEEMILSGFGHRTREGTHTIRYSSTTRLEQNRQNNAFASELLVLGVMDIVRQLNDKQIRVSHQKRFHTVQNCR